MNKTVRLLIAARLWSIQAPISAAILGSCLAYKHSGSFHVSVFFLQVFCMIPAYGFTNLLNTYFDFVNKVDGPESADQTLVNALLKPKEVLVGSKFALSISIMMFGLLALISPAPPLNIVPLFVAGIIAGALYTAGPGLKYYALGDAIVFLVCGAVSVLFTYVSQGGSLAYCPHVALYSLPLGFNITCTLHSNNSRDLDSDSRKNVLTVAVLLGRHKSYYYFLVLIFSPFLIFTGLILKQSFWFILPMFTILDVFKCRNNYISNSLQKLDQEVMQMNLKQMTLYAVAWQLQ